jgi:hypothetical protein
VNTGYNFSNAKSYLIPQKIILKPQTNIQTNKLVKSQSNESKNSNNLNNHPNNTVKTNQADQRKIYTKINEERYKRLIIVIEKFKQSNSSKHLTGIDKSRFSGKENIFSSLVNKFS